MQINRNNLIHSLQALPEEAFVILNASGHLAAYREDTHRYLGWFDLHSGEWHGLHPTSE